MISARIEPGTTRAPATKQLLKETAEPGAIELKVFSTRVTAAKWLAAETARTRRRTKFGTRFPIGPQFVIFFAFVRVGQNLVGLVDFLEFFLGLLLVLGDVGMIFARQFAEGL